LEKWKIIADAQMKALSEEPKRPNAKLGAERILVSQLAGIFRERTGKDPHVRASSDKDEYFGDFFEFANDMLMKVGSQRTDRARGNMIKDQLTTLTICGEHPARRSPRKRARR
jgi:hypothetical protein